MNLHAVILHYTMKCSSFVINGSDVVLRVYDLEDLLVKSAKCGDSNDDVEALQHL